MQAPLVPTAEPSTQVETPPPDPCEGKVVGMACIAGGEFLRGSVKGAANEQPQARIWVDSFLMDITEVTVEAYEGCVSAKKCKPAHTVYNDFSRPKQPKVGIRWYDAVDFCKAFGKHLPTEAEWEKAARGTDGRLYPWGDQVADCNLAVIKDARGRSCGVLKAGADPDKGRTFEVGSKPPNQYGLLDMSGNAWEWVADWYSPSYSACGDACLGKNPKGPCDGAEPCKGKGERVVRGGSWFWDASYATTTHRHHHYPSNNPYHHYGFRCAASLNEAKALR
ncbi:MAG: SUMF1/EgtB/PvdO family nonheme iron enzyme [Polyangiaceae bacterium]|nr:SUMF1/EgtB/PvdO family nonheme iron enzyme [Polyangiaceae bacterium]